MSISVSPADMRAPAPAPFEPLAIAVDRCKGCALCVGSCPKHLLALDETVVNALGYHPIRFSDSDACTSCALCARICPDAVYTVYAHPKNGPSSISPKGA